MAYKQLVVEQIGRQLCIVLDTIDQHLNLAYRTILPFRSHSQIIRTFCEPQSLYCLGSATVSGLLISPASHLRASQPLRSPLQLTSKAL